MKTSKIFVPALAVVLMLSAFSVKLQAQCTANFTFTVNNASVTFTDASTGYTLPVYTWDFGDASLGAYSANPVHAYNSAGTYTVTLTVQDSLTQCQNSYSAPVTVSAGCNFLTAGATTTNCTTSASCDGTATATVSGGNAPFAYTWSNSSNATSQNSLCCGYYTLTVTDAIGCTSTANVTVNCPDSCHADFSTSVGGNTVYITNMSNDTASNVNFQWSFGDATSSNLTSPGSHTYATSGTYTIMLIMNDFLNSCTDTVTATVNPGGPSSCYTSLNFIQDSSNALHYYGYAYASGQAPFTYHWDFGDGDTSNLAAPTHTYASSGTYTVCLTVTDANNCISSSCDSNLRHIAPLSMQSLTIINTTPTGIAPHNEISIRTWPNPAADLLNLAFGRDITATIRVTDMRGKIVLEQKVNGDQAQLRTNSLPAGIYNLSIDNDTMKWNEKIVIVH